MFSNSNKETAAARTTVNNSEIKAAICIFLFQTLRVHYTELIVITPGGVIFSAKRNIDLKPGLCF